MTKKEKFYNYTALVMSVIFAAISVLVIIGNLYIQNEFVKTINKAYAPVETGYNKAIEAFDKTEAALSEYEESAKSVLSTATLISGARADGSAKAASLEKINNLQGKILQGQALISEAKNKLGVANTVLGFLDDSAEKIDLPELSGEKLDNLSQKVDGISVELADLENKVTLATPKTANNVLTDKLTGRVEQAFGQADQSLSQAESELTTKFNELAKKKDNLIFWTRFTAVVVTIFFTWAVVSSIDLIRSKWLKIKKDRKS